MREATFVRQNSERWKRFEELLRGTTKPTPDQLSEMFIQLTDDLSFANTQYPQSRTANYLNQLTAKIHLAIYKNKKEQKGRFVTFWKHELPLEVYAHRKKLFYAWIIFVVSGILGAVSALYDDTFVRLILGDAYVNMTINNIREGNPLAVYGITGQSDMFLMITFNNLRVSLIAFAAGIMVSVGTGILLFSNGIMVGAFLTFFFREGLLAHSLSVIMLHGTIELSAIVIAGGAGLVMGNAILFPGTYSRFVSFRRGALSGLKIVVGLVPFIVIAGFIESFVTRYTMMPAIFKVAIIAASAFVIIYYFVIYPIILQRRGNTGTN